MHITSDGLAVWIISRIKRSTRPQNGQPSLGWLSLGGMI